jgi:exodeoxyribonuclease VII small subunit
MMSKKKSDTFEFEEGMQRLEEIIQQFDEGSLSLDHMENHFVEGMELLDQCSQRLEQVETRVTQLVQHQKDKWKEVPVDAIENDSEE